MTVSAASRNIPAGTVIEISPVLLFSQDEYKQHGRYTALDHYTFVWPDGRMALAFGLGRILAFNPPDSQLTLYSPGSLFNHSHSPNVSYQLDTDTESIRYVTSRPVPVEEELCIFYGHKLWFQDVNGSAAVEVDREVDDGWGGLSKVVGERDDEHRMAQWPWLNGKTDDVVAIDQLPFTRIRLTPDDDEEDHMEAIRTGKVNSMHIHLLFSLQHIAEAWAVDIADSRQIAAMLKWLRQVGLEDASLSHLKRIRKTGNTSSLLLAPVSVWPDPPPLPDAIDLPAPYIVTIPRNVALTQVSLKLKSTLWPTKYAPRKKWEPEPWTRGKIRWAWEAMKIVVSEAKAARVRGEVRDFILQRLFSLEANNLYLPVLVAYRGVCPPNIRRRVSRCRSITTANDSS